jgi:hypothetical protein
LLIVHIYSSSNGGGSGGGDRAWEFPYPSLCHDGRNSMIDFDQVIRYRVGHEDHPFIREEIGSTYSNNNDDDDDDDDDYDDAPSTSTSTSTSTSISDNLQKTTNTTNAKQTRTRKVAIVTYGNGVVTSLQARTSLLERQDVISINNEELDTDIDIDIIDCPYLSDVPKGLENIICDYDYILFADICKEGPGSNIFSSMITTLQQKRKFLSTSRWQFIGAPRTYVSIYSSSSSNSFYYIESIILLLCSLISVFCSCFLLAFILFLYHTMQIKSHVFFFQNPLGSTVTFLNQDRIEDAVIQMLKDDVNNDTNH